MEQGTYVNPNPLALERTSGQLLFKPVGASSYDDFGVIDVTKVATSPTSDKVMFAVNGSSLIGVDEVTSISPVLSFDGHQFTDAVEAYLNSGTQSTDATQASATGATATINAVLGKTFDLGARNITFTSLTVSGAAKVRDVDFFVDEPAGLIRFPFVAAGIAAGAAVIVTFDKAALTRKSYIGGSTLNFYGTLLYLEKDNKSSTVRAEWGFSTGVLRPKAMGDSDIKKNKMWSMEYAVSGQWTKLKRAA